MGCSGVQLMAGVPERDEFSRLQVHMNAYNVG